MGVKHPVTYYLANSACGLVRVATGDMHVIVFFVVTFLLLLHSCRYFLSSFFLLSFFSFFSIMLMLSSIYPVR